MREFNTREAKGDYSITFDTDDRKAFEQVQTLCRILIDGKDGDAIPIEWIEDKIKENEPISTARAFCSSLRILINLWEKENE